MKTMSLEQQRQNLRQMARPGLLKGLKTGAALLTLGLLVAGLLTRFPPWFMGAFMSGVVWASAWRGGPHLTNAARALSEGQLEAGHLRIEVTRWSDADTYQATTWGASSGCWRFEFLPQGWVPQTGDHVAHLYLLPGLAWPALVELSGNLLCPRHSPQALAPVQSENPAPSAPPDVT